MACPVRLGANSSAPCDSKLALGCGFSAALFCAPHLDGQESVFVLDPSKSSVEFTLGASLHTVHGTFKLKSGEIHFDPAKGTASGAIVVDASSGESSNEGRDKKMHQGILESPKFSKIVFVPARIEGKMAPHQDHAMTLNFSP
jgi:polyisoprenoid-binding protein YceI